MMNGSLLKLNGKLVLRGVLVNQKSQLVKLPNFNH